MNDGWVYGWMDEWMSTGQINPFISILGKINVVHQARD